jgi:4-oxalocrotonate tautomerase
MPLSRISLRRGKSAAHKKAIMDGIYRALRETFDVPDGDLFMVMSEHDEDTFVYDDSYLGIARSDDLVIIQITANDTRTVGQKKALYARTAALLAESPGLRPEDVFVSIVEVAKENWSFGRGIAQYA